GRQRTPLHLAAARGADAMVDLLLVHGADPAAADEEGAAPLHLACRAGHLSAARRLLAANPDVMPDLHDATPLHMAARAGSLELVQLLVDAGHAVECVDEDGWTPLHVAAQTGALDVVTRLLPL